jgi:hypothetical protein
MKKAGLRRLFSCQRLQITSCQCLLVRQAQVQLVPAQRETQQVQQVQQEPMRFRHLFHRMQPKRESTELQSKQNDS